MCKIPTTDKIRNIQVIKSIIVKPKKPMKTIPFTATVQKVKDGEWCNEAGQHIPVNRLTPSEKLMEKYSAKLLKDAINLNAKLKQFKDAIRDMSQEAYNAFMEEKTTNRETKGNFTWYNFDRSIKIEVSVNQPIKFDDLTITKAKQKFDVFLDANITSKNAFVKEMIINAFETQRTGSLDVKKVMDITRYESKVNDPLFSEAVALINSAIRRPKTKTYFRVWQRNQAGEYDNIDLNISSI